MSLAVEQPDQAVPARRSPDEWSRWDRVVGGVLTAAWLTLLVALVALGARETSVDQLEAGLRTGEVAEVQVTGHVLAPGSTGYSTHEVRWRTGLLTRVTEITQASSPGQARRARADADDRTVIVGSLEDHLKSFSAALSIDHGSQHREASFNAVGFHGPGWLTFLYLGLLVGVVLLLGGPRPWRATRWAWAWLVLLVPFVGIGAWLLLGGPLGILRPRDPRRIWLTGGWAFLLALCLGNALKVG